MTAMAAPAAIKAPSLQLVTDFIADEVALLDDRKFDDWNDLFTPDGLYWVPAALDQDNPYDHISVQFEDALLRKVRIARFRAPDAYSLQPFPRSVHMVANIRMLDFDGATGLLNVRSKFTMLHYQRDITTTFGGTYRHALVWDGETFKIQMKRVDLINCDGTLECINLYF